ncbi:thiamine pyrophosphate-binding protein [Streptomyces decoyicus]
MTTAVQRGAQSTDAKSTRAIRRAFLALLGNPGSSELTLLEEFPSDFRCLLGLREMVPVGMADGFSQVTGRPALVLVHTARPRKRHGRTTRSRPCGPRPATRSR